MATRRTFLFRSAALAGTSALPSFAQMVASSEINVLSTGARGDGTTLDTVSIQSAIDRVAAAGGGRVLLPGKKQFLTGSLFLKSHVELHLADDAVLLASPNPEHYAAPSSIGIINCDRVSDVKITGTGHVDGQGMKFMGSYSPVDERWEPLAFRPKMFRLLRCSGLEISGISFGHSPEWGLHTLGCDHVLVDGIRIRNYLDVPNCDGIDPDRCRDMEIKNCDIVCADDGIVVKTSDQAEDFGPAHNISVRDCSITCRDSGLKIGTETFGDISKILFERCRIVSGGRGPTITHRHTGNISDVEFRDIEISAQHHAARWWGWGEAASVTEWPRKDGTKLGTLNGIRMKRIRGAAENSFRIDARPEMPIADVLMEDCDILIDRWTNYPGQAFDDRPSAVNDTLAGPRGLEPHDTPVFFLRNVNGATLRNCTARWGAHTQSYFGHALEAHNVTKLRLEHFTGDAAHPGQKPMLLDNCSTIS